MEKEKEGEGEGEGGKRILFSMNRTTDLHVPYILHHDARSRSHDAEVHTLEADLVPTR